MYKAIVVPLPQMDEDIAIKWDVEAEYLAVSENMMETSLVTRDQLDKCIGSRSIEFAMKLWQQKIKTRHASQLYILETLWMH